MFNQKKAISKFLVIVIILLLVGLCLFVIYRRNASKTNPALSSNNLENSESSSGSASIEDNTIFENETLSETNEIDLGPLIE
ncbi:MAG: hypothetical protein ACOYT4_04620 [Nanoarchaeota archaeon]